MTNAPITLGTVAPEFRRTELGGMQMVTAPNGPFKVSEELLFEPEAAKWLNEHTDILALDVSVTDGNRVMGTAIVQMKGGPNGFGFGDQGYRPPFTGTMNEIGADIVDWARRNGFEPITTIDGEEAATRGAARVSQIHGELSEMVQAIRRQNKENLAEETADSIIMLLAFASSMGYDIPTIIERKMLINLTRPPKNGSPVSF